MAILATAQYTITNVFDGDSGADAIIAILDNDSHVVPTDEEGKHGNYIDAKTTIAIYEGSKNVTDKWKITTASTDGIEGSLKGATFTVEDMSTDSGTVRFTATRSGFDSIYKNFMLSKSKRGLQGQSAVTNFLETDVSYLRKDSIIDEIVPSSINIYGKHMIGETEDEAFNGYFVIYEQSSESITVDEYAEIVANSEITEDREYILSDLPYPFVERYRSNTSESHVKYSPTINALGLRVEWYKDQELTVLLDREDVPVLIDTQNQLDMIDVSLDELENITLPALEDGVLNKSEKEAIRQSLNVVKTDKAGMDSQYTAVYNNTVLKGTPKTNLYNDKVKYNTAYTLLEGAVKAVLAIKDNVRIDKSVIDNVDTRFANYGTALAQVRKRLEEAIDAISNNKVEEVNDALINVEQRVATAEHKITDDAIRSTVTSSTTFKTVQNNASSAKSTLDSKSGTWDAKATTGYVDTKASNAETSAKTHADGKASTAEANAKNYAKQQVDELEIGGRNLLLDSKRFIETSSYSMADYTLVEPIPENAQVTLSLKGDLHKDKIYFGIYNSGGNLSLVTLRDADEDGVYRTTFRWRIGNMSNTYLRVYHMTNATTAVSKIEWIKLEYGNKATDYSPAQEDVEKAYTAVAEAKASLAETQAKAHADGKISAEEKRAIEDAKKKLDEAKAHANTQAGSAETRAKTHADGKAETAETNAKDYAKKQVDDIEVGGRNLAHSENIDYRHGILTSNSTKNISGNGRWYIEIQAGFLPNTTYTISNIKVVNNGSRGNNLHVLIYNDAISSLVQTIGSFSSAGIRTFTTSSNVQETDRMLIYVSDGGTLANFEIHEFKLEKGNKATDWTPAPEDIQLESDKKTYLPVRYIRDWQNGSTANSSCHWYEIEAYINGENVARGKTTSGATNSSRVTDGNRAGSYATGGVGKKYIQVDLGKAYFNVDSVGIWHYHNDGRTYKETMTEVSPDGTNWYPIFDSAVEGEYETSAEGRVFPNTWARYEAVKTPIRLTERISTAEQKITDDAIRSTVTSSTTFKDVQSKANSAKETLDSKSGTWDSKATTNYVDGKASTAETNAKSHADSKASTAESNAKNYAKQQVDDIEVGGRNLLTGTSEEELRVQSASYSIGAWNPGLSIGEEYTFSFDIKSEKATYLQNVFLNSSNSGFVPNHPITKEWTRVQFTFEWKGGTYSGRELSPHVYPRPDYSGTYVSRIKLEKGNKATDWAVAPEDVEKAYTAVAEAKANLAKTQAEAYADGEITKEEKRAIADAEKKLSEAKTHANTQAGNAETNAKTHADGKAETAETNAKNYAKKQVDDIEVGGKNLAIDSTNGGSGWTSTAYNVISGGQLSENWVVGETYTVSIKGTVNSPNRFGIWRDTGSVGLGNLMDYNPSTGVHTQTYVNIRDTTQSVKDRFSIYNVPSGSATQAKIEWIKIEKGNKATDWTPAPEDIEEGIETAQSTADNAKSTADTLKNTTVPQLATRVNTAEQKITDKAIVSTVTESTTYKDEMTGKVGVNEVISRINQTANNVTIDAKNINLNGAVTISSFGKGLKDDFEATKSSADTALDRVTIKDTRTTNQSPSWYYQNHPSQTVTETKESSAIGFTGATVGTLTTVVPSSSSSGGAIKQTFRTGSESWRRSGTTSWTSWSNYDRDGRLAKAGLEEVEGKINNAVTTIDGTGVTVKDGSFFLEDDTSDTKYSLQVKRNMIDYHSFEAVMSFGGMYNDYTSSTTDYNDPTNTSISGSWHRVNDPRITSGGATHNNQKVGIFGKSMLVNNVHYVFLMLSASQAELYPMGQLTFSFHSKKPVMSIAGQPRVEIDIVDNNNTVVTPILKKNYPASTDKIKRHSVTFNIPGAYDERSQLLRIRILSANGSEIVIDGVQLVDGPNPVQYDPATEVWNLRESLGMNSYHTRGNIGNWGISPGLLHTHQITVPNNQDGRLINFMLSDGLSTHMWADEATVSRKLNLNGGMEIYGNVNGNLMTYKNTGKTIATINATVNSANRWNSESNSSLILRNNNNALSFIVGGTQNNRQSIIQGGHSDAQYASALSHLYINKFGGTTYIGSGLSVSGSKNAIHITRDGMRATPAYEMAESYLGDMGEDATGLDGSVDIMIDTLFFDTINTDYTYHVFLQAHSNNKVWVEKRNAKSFVVKSDAPNVSFSWEMKAKRRGYEKDRLVRDDNFTYEDIQTMQEYTGAPEEPQILKGR